MMTIMSNGKTTLKWFEIVAYQTFTQMFDEDATILESPFKQLK